MAKREQYVVSIWVDKELIEKLDEIAKDEERSRSQVALRLLKNAMEAKERDI